MQRAGWQDITESFGWLLLFLDVFCVAVKLGLPEVQGSSEVGS